MILLECSSIRLHTLNERSHDMLVSCDGLDNEYMQLLNSVLAATHEKICQHMLIASCIC